MKNQLLSEFKLHTNKFEIIRSSILAAFKVRFECDSNTVNSQKA